MSIAPISSSHIIVLLAAFLIVSLASRQVGQAFQRFKLPLVTGFLFTGILCGPHVLSLIPEAAVEQLHFIDKISLSFIAFAAGSELYMREMRAQVKSIKWVTIGLVVVTLTFGVVAVMLLGERIPFLVGRTTTATLGIALLAGTILVSRSPSSAIAVMNEMRAKGPLSQTAMGVTVVMDVVVIALFAVNSSIASALLTDMSFSLGFIALLAIELGVSVLLGAVLGFVLHLILASSFHHTIKSGFLVVLGAGVFYLTLHFREYTHEHWPFEVLLEPLLICMIASFAVINFSRHRAEMRRLLFDIGPAIYIAFFTLTGASLALDVLVSAWAIALILFVVRIAAIALGSFAGSAMAGNPMKLNRLMWMGFVTQAGIGLGLARGVAVEFPEWGAAFAAILTAVIVLNEIAGPPLFKWAISLAGEAHRRANAAEFSAVRDCIIFGLEDQSLTLARQLQAHNWDVKIASRKARYREDLDTAEVQIVPIPDHSLRSLRSLRMEEVEAIVTMLSDDENYQVCELAYEHFGTKDMVVRLNDRANFDRFHELGALIVDPRTAIVSLLEHFVRSPVATSILLGMAEDQDMVGMEMLNPDLHGVAVRDLNLPFDIHIVSVRRDGNLIISQGYTQLELGDWVTISGNVESINKVMLMFER